MLSNECLTLISLLRKPPMTQTEIRRYAATATGGAFSPKKGGTRGPIDRLVTDGLLEEFQDDGYSKYRLTTRGEAEALRVRFKLENLLYDGPSNHLLAAIERVDLHSQEVEPEEAADVLEFAAREITAARKNLEQAE